MLVMAGVTRTLSKIRAIRRQQSWSDWDRRPVIDSAATSFDTKGWAGGFQAGYNWQFDPRWVAGIEADINGADIKGSSTVSANSGGSPFATFSASQKVDWFGTLRARVGYLLTNDLLLYATGGLAYGRVKESAAFGLIPGASLNVTVNGVSFTCINPGSPTCFAGSNSRTSAGWTAGGGAEYRFWQSWSVKLEYLYVNLGSDSFFIPAVTPNPGTTPSVLNVHFDNAAFNLVRAGVNYRF
jgi:outer membrane immunogenic protein